MGFFEVADKVWGALAGVTASILQSLKKKRDISLVVGEYRDKAVYKSGGNPNLVQLFSSKERLEEFVEHCKTGDISRDQAVGLFLYDVPCINGTNASAETFVLHFYDDVVAVLDKVDSNDAKALAAAVRRSDRNSAERDQQLLAKIERLSKYNEPEGIELLRQSVISLEKGVAEITDFELSPEASRGSRVMRYLSAYHDLCTGCLPESGVSEFSGMPAELLISLACLAFSAGETKYCIGVLNQLPDSGECFDAIKAFVAKGEQQQFLLDNPVTPDSNYFPLVVLVTAERLFRGGAFFSAFELFRSLSERLNPIARARKMICDFYCKEVISDTAIEVDSILEFVRSVPCWAAPELLTDFETIANHVLEALDDDAASKALETLPEDCPLSFTSVEDKIRLSEAQDALTVEQIMDRSYESNNGMLYYKAVDRLRCFDEGKANAELVAGGRAEQIAQRDFVAFLWFARNVSPSIGKEDYMRIGMRHRDHAQFYLLAHEKYETDALGTGSEYLEIAIERMKQGFELPVMDFAEIWVGYLHDGGRDDELREILNLAYPVLPYVYAKHLVFAIGFEDDRDDLLGEVLSGLVGYAGGRAELLALIAYGEFYRFRHDWLKARTFAVRSFELKQAVMPAYIAIEAMMRLHEPVPHSLADFAGSSAHQELLFALAESECRAGDAVNCDTHLVRGILAGGEQTEKGIARYAIQHLSDRTQVPETIGPDTVSCLMFDDGGVMYVAFHAIVERVCGEGSFGVGASHYTTNAREYLCLRGAHLGDCRSFGGKDCRIESISSLVSYLCAEGMKIIAADPTSQVIRAPEGDASQAIAQITEMLEENARERERRLALLNGGIEVGEGRRLYLGVESGSRLLGVSQLEFTVHAFLDPGLPLKRPWPGKTCLLKSDSKFLVSYNAVVAMALILQEGFVLDGLSKRFKITAATDKRLREDVSALVRNSETSEGRLVVKDGKPYRIENDDVSKDNTRNIAGGILSVLESFDAVDLVGNSRIANISKPFDIEGESMLDMATAAELGYVFITEDPLHFVMSGLVEGAKACTLQTALTAVGRCNDVLKIVIPVYEKWRMEPVVDPEIGMAIGEILANLGLDAGGKEDSESCPGDHMDAASDDLL